ncbi:PTS glucose transporter subunit IIA [Bacillus sp. DNRA2]|uniref:PTS sugar transporter subunit IIA n=1 Tax=Bacillus sp. DNRA2 TaxID=2723053 RepID=UPI00145CE89D|nr:PTS glucose transporter subunit IIA [Bacillus sp. DNRA2]NMD70059.1 PTS glucose transporter subunit IIA [Bacillus sp. DNRA2]
MAWKFFKKDQLQIFTPVDGKVIPLEEVPDPVFSQKMMGEGVAVIPETGNVYAPVNGTIIQIANTKHAVGILTKDGTEILIHVGLDTVSLKGQGFHVPVKLGDEVSMGDLLIEVDWEFLKANGKNIVTPIVITNSQNSEKTYAVTAEKEVQHGKSVILTASS